MINETIKFKLYAMKTILTSCLLCFYLNTNSATLNKQVTLYNGDIILDTIIEVESNNRNIEGCTKDVGYLQITPIFVDDVNRLVGYHKFTYNDRWNKSKSIAMYYIYQKHYNPTYDFKLACMIHHRASKLNEQLTYFNKCKTMATKLILTKCINAQHKDGIMNCINSIRNIKHQIVEVRTEKNIKDISIMNSQNTILISLSSTLTFGKSVSEVLKYLI